MSTTNSGDHRQKALEDIIEAINAATDVRMAVSRAENEGQLFSCDKIVSELARGPSGFDREEKFRIEGELMSWANNGNFARDEMLVVLAGDPPRLCSIQEIVEQGDSVPIGAVMLTPPACKRFLERNTAEIAPRLLRAWFGKPHRPRSSGDRAVGQSKPGPKGKVRRKIVQKMIADLRECRRTVEALRGDTLAALSTEYGGSPNTAGAARATAISEFQSSNNSEKL